MTSFNAFQSSGGSRDCGSFFLDVVGRFGPDQVNVNWLETPRPTNEQIEEMIDNAWSNELKKAKTIGRRLFNGHLCRVIDYKAQDSRFHVTLGPVGYREYIGTNLTQAHVRYLHGPEVLADPLGVYAPITTSDGFLLMGRRSQWVAHHAGRIHPFGGMVEPADDQADAPDPFASLTSELQEETGLEDDHLTEVLCLGLVRDKHIVQPELIFDVSSNLEMNTIREMSRQADDAAEHAELVPVLDHPSAVVTFIEKQVAELTPIALASLLMHGLRHWGSGWFASARGYLRSVI
ncbi:MAG: hypothetical protein ACLFVU_00795 [Phycisphaerae bacterium]